MAMQDEKQTRPSVLRRYRTLIVIAGVAILIPLWAAFRPEKLFTTVKVNESAPAGLAEAQPLFTGSLHTVGAAVETHGRINILKSGSDLQLQVANLDTKAAGPFTVSITAKDPGDAGAADDATNLGTVPDGANPRVRLPAGTDPTVSKYVLLSDAAKHPVAKATLDKF